MSSPALPSSSPRQSPYVALLITGASAMLAGFALGYALGTVHAYERRLPRKGPHGV